jgi:hypothetical protein
LELKENDMEIPEKKLEELKAAGFDVEALMADLKAGADAESRESKEVEGEKEPTETKAEVETAGEPTTSVAVTEETVTESAEELPTVLFTEHQMEALADAFSTALQPIQDRLDVLETEPLPPEESPKEKDGNEQLELPSDFLGKLLHSRVIGNEQTRVDGRTKEANDKPKEAESDADAGVRLAHPMAEQTINRLLTGATYRELQDSNAE